MGVIFLEFCSVNQSARYEYAYIVRRRQGKISELCRRSDFELLLNEIQLYCDNFRKALCTDTQYWQGICVRLHIVKGRATSFAKLIG